MLVWAQLELRIEVWIPLEAWMPEDARIPRILSISAARLCSPSHQKLQSIAVGEHVDQVNPGLESIPVTWQANSSC